MESPVVVERVVDCACDPPTIWPVVSDTDPPFRAAHPEAHDAFLKIGIYAGPCYGVTANGILDYFGQSANIAARLQGAARAGQIVVPEELAARAGQSGWLGDARVTETFAASLKGLAEPVRAARIEVDVG